MGKKKAKPEAPETMFDIMSDLEGLIGDAACLNSTLMVLIDKPELRDINIELIRHLAGLLKEAKGKVFEGYRVTTAAKD